MAINSLKILIFGFFIFATVITSKSYEDDHINRHRCYMRACMNELTQRGINTKVIDADIPRTLQQINAPISGEDYRKHKALLTELSQKKINITTLKQTYIEQTKKNIPLIGNEMLILQGHTLSSLPDHLLLSAGFGPAIKSPLEELGCCLRLGNALRHTPHIPHQKFFTTQLFLKSGVIYAQHAFLSSQKSKAMAEPPQEDLLNTIDLLISTAQCYHWAFCNEIEEKALQKYYYHQLAKKYLDFAYADSKLLAKEEQRQHWQQKIARERKILH